MSQTQLASMYLGNPYVHDRDERLRGVSSQLNATIHILDGQSYNGEILDYITAKNIISDSHKKSLEDTLETYNFITFADRRFSEHLEKRNRLIIPDEDGTPIEFIIFEAHKYRDSEGHKAQVYAHASYLELKKASIIYPGSFKGTASQHGGRVLNATGWQIGMVEVSGDVTISNDKHSNPYEMLKRIAKEFNAELRFRIEHNGNNVTGRYVDLLQRVGEWRGREIEYGKDLDGIRRVEKQDVVTALLGLGPEDENGNRIEVLVEDEEALQRWGRIDEYGKLNHLIEPYEIQSTRDDMTTNQARQYTRTALDKRINTQVTYEATIVDLENAPGMQNKKIRFGDTIRIKDTKFNPPLYLEARVFEQTRSIKSRAKKDIKLGDFIEFTEEEVNAIWIMLQREIRKKIDIETLKEYAEPKKVESDTPPEIKDEENPIWVDTSRTPHVSHVVNGGEWVKMTPTTPEEVNAYNKQQVDEKADQALKDAKAFARNADNITEGVVDVGAVPLRTSATGARLEWDGVNGLVQYDSAGEPVSWIGLDGNIRLVNAFLSGRIEANEGHFSGDVTGATGTFSGDLEGSTIRGSLIVLNKALGDDDNVGLTGTYDHVDSRYNRAPIRYDGTLGINSAYMNFRSKTTGAEGTPEEVVEFQIADYGANSLDIRKFRTSSNGTATGSFRGNIVGAKLYPDGLDFFKGGTSETNTTWTPAASFHAYGFNAPEGLINDMLYLPYGRITGENYESTLRIGANFIASMRFYDYSTTYTTQMLRVSGSGVVSRSTSSRRYKLCEEEVPLSYAKKIHDLSAVSWFDKRDAEKHADYLTKVEKGITVTEDDRLYEDITRVGGVIAEDVHDVGLEMYVNYDEKERPDGISQNLWSLLIPISKEHERRIGVVENKIDTFLQELEGLKK